MVRNEFWVYWVSRIEETNLNAKGKAFVVSVLANGNKFRIFAIDRVQVARETCNIIKLALDFRSSVIFEHDDVKWIFLFKSGGVSNVTEEPNGGKNLQTANQDVSGFALESDANSRELITASNIPRASFQALHCQSSPIAPVPNRQWRAHRRQLAGSTLC